VGDETKTIETLPRYASADDELKAAFRDHAQIVSIRGRPAHCHAGGRMPGDAFVLDGVVRIYKLGESGREIALYRGCSGDSCILTASCIMSQEHFRLSSKRRPRWVADN
jgi:CRP/FNR family transcriptional regulator, anaerobic regulatory protein